MTDESFLSGANAAFLADVHAAWVRDPASVGPEWAAFFSGLDDDAGAVIGDHAGPSWGEPRSHVVAPETPPPATKAAPGPTTAHGPDLHKAIHDSIMARMYIRNHRVRGHLLADLDPLKRERKGHLKEEHKELDWRSYGFTDADLDREIFVDGALGLETATLRHIIDAVKATYCGRVGVEFMHIQDPEKRDWIQNRIETFRNQTAFTDMGKRAILHRLIAAEGLEQFLNKRYTGTKRFGLDGGESLIPALEQIVKRAAQEGVKEIVIGMPHRGRINVLGNFMNKPFKAILSEFEGVSSHPEDMQGSGDVKYHLGTSSDRVFDDLNIHLSLTANPSHLEAVDPVVLGKVRAKQRLRGDDDHAQVMGVLMHGDAAFAGQGVVAECFGFSKVRGYRTGGTVHFIVNNQIGFTTSPYYSRSSPYCTDVAKVVQAPIFHVNGDDPEAVVHVARVATEYRQKFKRDVVVDMVCYRRFGHNEVDEPMFTNPIMYKIIAKQPTTAELYARRLIDDGVVSADEILRWKADYEHKLSRAYDEAKGYKPVHADWLEGRWKGISQATGDDELHEERTAAPVDMLLKVGKAISTPPPASSFDLNPKLERQLKAKAEMFATGAGIDWATAEALAFGTLLSEGFNVRLSGQDVQRGTFSQRHVALIDQTTEAMVIPLNAIDPGNQGRMEVYDSPLSEYSVLGFEYGYSLSSPNSLVLWEAQFGDFANGAQVIFDQFLSSAESKWLRMSGLVILLPHGHEGQGPEHSSGRVERYLQLCAEDNLQVCNCTTPANYFHVLRRQLKRNFRKPLILMTPKSLLRHKRCVSRLDDFAPGSRFRRVLPDDGHGLRPDGEIRRVVMCSGKVYYDLLQAREDRGLDDVALLRVEQLYPWPRLTLHHELSRYPKADVVWCQEEPANQGGWIYAHHRVEFLLSELPNAARQPLYAGRPASASPAEGTMGAHNRVQAEIVEKALTWAADALDPPFQRATRLSQLMPEQDRNEETS